MRSKPFLTPEQYLEIERAAEFRHEYREGKRFARAASDQAHCLVTVNVAAEIRRQLRSRPGEVYLVDMRVMVPGGDLCAYPDVVVVCGKPEFLDDRQDTLLNPNLIVEVLSHSTEAYDRGRKFKHYRSIESLREYLLVSSDQIGVDLFTRQPDGNWLLTSANRPEDSIELHSIDCQLNLADLYEKVEFA